MPIPGFLIKFQTKKHLRQDEQDGDRMRKMKIIHPVNPVHPVDFFVRARQLSSIKSVFAVRLDLKIISRCLTLVL